jgi:hypothetical protein
MTSSYPEFIQAQAYLVVALALQLDDERIQSRRLSAEADELNREIARLQQEKSPSDYLTRISVKQARLSPIASLTGPMMEKVGVIATTLNDRFLTLQALQPATQADQLAVTTSERFNASVIADDELRAAVDGAHRNIASFSRKSLRRNWSARNRQGASGGEKFDAFGRVGIYIPGGTAPLVSTALMTVTLAKAAGCGEIVVCTPPNRQGRINSALLYALNIAGATEIYKAGGAQAIAAMALGRGRCGECRRFSGRGTLTWWRRSGCWWGMWRLIYCRGRARCWCWRMRRRKLRSRRRICWRRRSMVRGMSGCGW